MSHWNHRVFVVEDASKYDETWYFIGEVFYNDDGEIDGHTGPIPVTGESIKDLRQALEWMLKSLDAPILNAEEKKYWQTPSPWDMDEE